MFVKSLTLRGFKSFASATNFVLEPGITCIVGPNGSGKSNVVDALAWVMGEASARTLRGGKMDDVIFAGTAGRGPLGRAEVSLTIDNSDGALPIDYSEVTISRTMFRGGGSEYAINRTPCRLLDIQELLSDSGIGREMHVIVGQGQLDAVLQATPQERRGFIEEAAGILKHRQRKERAVRKLESMESNLTRVADLTGEVRRQLGPLGRQAETARRAQHIQADVRDARARLLADDLVQQRAHLEVDLASEKSLLGRKFQLEGESRAIADAIGVAERVLQESAPALEKLQSQWYELSSLGEKLESEGRLSAERARLLTLTATESSPSGRDPEALTEQAERIRGEERELQQRVDQARESVEMAIAVRERLENAHLEEQQRIARLARAAADRREGLAKLHGQVEVRRSRVEAGEAELRRLQVALEESAARAGAASAELAPLKQELATLKEAAPEQQNQMVRAGERHAHLLKQREERRNERNRLTQRAGADRARIEAFTLTLGSVSATPQQLQGFDAVRRPLADYLRIEPGYEVHVAAALGGLTQALLVDSREAAADILSQLRGDDGGFVEFLVTGATMPQTTSLDLPPDSRLLVDVVVADGEVASMLAHLGHNLVLVPGPEQALHVVAQGGRAVTPQGDYYDETIVRGGGKLAPSTLEIRAALDSSESDLAAVEAELADCIKELEKIEAPLMEAQQLHAEAAAAERNLELSLQRLGAQIERAERDISGALRERDQVTNQIAEAGVALESNREQLVDLEARLGAASDESASDQEPSTLERDRLAREAAEARTRETEARLTLRSHEERVRGLSGRAEGLEAAARSERAAREKAQERRARAARAAHVAHAAQTAAHIGREEVVKALVLLGAQRDDETARRSSYQNELAQLRERLADVEQRLAEVADSVHRDELARAALRLRLEALEAKAHEELGLEPDVLMEEFGPHRPIPTIGEDGEPHELAFGRAEQEKRLKRAERDLKALGKVNPLALEEFAALEERHQFLVTQLEDLRSSKKDLLQLVAEVDRRVEQVFAEAFADVAREFEGVFERLFPGGEGRLILTDPDDMLTTGLDVEARPPGKKIKRLSLLSGGERSLVAVALLVSIFKARPSPFYIMDEVEAALDDANLGRLISLFEELRESSQLIVITHQKRTMEVADALYGVSMRGDGVTTVVSQRLADVAPAAFAAPQ